MRNKRAQYISIIPASKSIAWPTCTILIALLFSFNSFAEYCETPLITFQDIAEKSSRRIQNAQDSSRPEDSTPKLLQASLTKGAHFLEQPLRQATPHRYYRPLGVGGQRGLAKGYVGLRYPVNFEGKRVYTNVGVNPTVLAENIGRKARGEQRNLVSSSARAAVIWLHGGGTNQSSWQNGANAAGALASKGIEVISLDFFGHGEGPNEFYKDPEAYIRFVMEFMNSATKGSDIPVILAGHSMGGMIADIVSNLYPKERLAKEFPNLKLSGVAMLSPPADPTPEEPFKNRFEHENQERVDDEQEKNLTLADNINLPSQHYLLVLSFLHRWSKELVNNSDDHLPIFFAMGSGDELWQGKEHLFEEFVNARKNISSANFKIYSDGVDHNNKPVIPGHIIPAVYSADRPALVKQGKKAQNDPRISLPIVFVDLLDFIERDILQSTYEYKLHPEQDSINSLAKVIELWGGSSFFRSFVEVFAKSTRTTDHPGKIKLLNSRALSLSNFGQFYFSKLVKKGKSADSKNPTITPSPEFSEILALLQDYDGRQISSSQNIQDWYQTLPDDLRSSFIFDFFSDLEELDPNDQGVTINRNSFFKIVDTPKELPANLNTIAILLTSKTDKELLVALKSEAVNISSLINGEYSSLVSTSDDRIQQRSKNRDELDHLSQKRSKTVSELSGHHAKQTQLVRVFVEFDIDELLDTEKELLTNPKYLRSLINAKSEIDSVNGTLESNSKESIEKASLILDAHLTILNDLFREIAFHSKMGFKTRLYLSDALNKLEDLKKIDLNNEKQLKKAHSVALNVASLSESFCEEVSQFFDFISNEKTIDRSRLAEPDRIVEERKANVFKTQQAFFEYREQLVGQWIQDEVFGTEDQPKYPAKYNELISEYQKAQDDFQLAKRERNAVFNEEAINSNLGLLIKFIANDIQKVSTRIIEIERDILPEIETYIQQLSIENIALQDSLDREFSQGLFRFERVAAQNYFGSTAHWPLQLGPIQDLLHAWKTIWREVKVDSGNLDAY